MGKKLKCVIKIRDYLSVHKILPNFNIIFRCLSSTEMYSLVLTVVLPPEKAEGCESYLQYLHSEDGEKEALRDASKPSGKKRISLDVRRNMTWQLFSAGIT